MQRGWVKPTIGGPIVPSYNCYGDNTPTPHYRINALHFFSVFVSFNLLIDSIAPRNRLRNKSEKKNVDLSILNLLLDFLTLTFLPLCIKFCFVFITE